jgi:hypothetical protein
VKLFPGFMRVIIYCAWHGNHCGGRAGSPFHIST